LISKALKISKSIFVNKADQAEKLEERILQWSGGEEELALAREGELQGVGDDVIRFVDIP